MPAPSVTLGTGASRFACCGERHADNPAATLAAQFPALVFTLTYDESGYGFGGTAVWSGDVLRCDTYSMLYDRQILTVVDGATVTECF